MSALDAGEDDTHLELGVVITRNAQGRSCIELDLQKIEAFKAAHGSEALMAHASEYVTRNCMEQGLIADLELWLEAVRALR